MNSVDVQDKIQQILKYVKYLLLLLPIIILFFVFKGCSNSYSNIEDVMEEAAKTYINSNNIYIPDETYIEISLLGDIEGTELCSKASGVLVKNESGKISYQSYLNCSDYQSSIIKNKGKYAELNGEAIILLNKGEAFNDPLYVLYKECDVIIQGTVGKTAGVYNINYNVYVDNILKEVLTRKVIVANSDKTLTISGLENTEYPSLVLSGEKNIVLSVGETYKEHGYRAVDYEDGKISRQVEVSGKVDTSETGTYTITYKVTNSKGNTTIETRIIKVVKQKSNLDITISLQNTDIGSITNIVVNINGDGYSYTIKPDGNRDSFRNIVYPASKNQIYSFKVYDKYGNEYIKEIEVTNIDASAPVGTCKATTSTNNTIIEVTASDNKGIGGYQYTINGIESVYQTENKYESAVEATSVSVNVKDIAGNVSTFSCPIEKKTLISNNSCGFNEIKVNIKTCFGNNIIQSNVDFEEYLMGVLYAEEDPGINGNMEYMKAFVIFARTYSLRRGGYASHPTYLNLRTCDSDQNWCSLDQGCYRNQTEEMFDQCIEYSLGSVQYSADGTSPYYDAKTCANRVTTFPGSSDVTNRMYYVSNSAWPNNYESSVMSTANTSRWKGAVNTTYRAYLQKAIAETAGMVIKKSDGSLADVGYYMCDRTEDNRIMCPNKAEELAENQGYTTEQLILAYTKAYQDIKVECYK